MRPVPTHADDARLAAFEAARREMLTAFVRWSPWADPETIESEIVDTEKMLRARAA